MLEENCYFNTNHIDKNSSMKIRIISVNNSKIYRIVERFMDIFLSLFGLLLLLPLFFILFILMKIENPRAKFLFSQKRIGKNNQVFNMYKIRSMCPDAEEKLKDILMLNEVSGAMFKMKDDPRITKIGKFIRKYSIDELPQLWNVLIGDMSLVGPRPPLPREVENYSSYDMQRLLIKPGCTGLWQTSGRNSLGFSEMVELDLIYINKQTFKFDCYLVLKTVKVILKPQNAY